jgi:hypothetical protein
MANELHALELRSAPSGLRHYLGGRPLHGGDLLQLCFSGGWVTGRYERDREHPDRAWFHCSIELDGGRTAEHVLAIPEGALVRRP